MPDHKPVLIFIGGSDPSSGAGIQRDIITSSLFPITTYSVITAVTSQSQTKFVALNPVSADLVLEQLLSIKDEVISAIDSGCCCIKIGLLPSAEVVYAIHKSISECQWSRKGNLIVLDPVLVSSTGSDLNDGRVLDALRLVKFFDCSVITPNLSELRTISRNSVDKDGSPYSLARELMSCGPQTVVVKSAYVSADLRRDLVCRSSSISILSGDNINGVDIHGSGCRYATVLSSHLLLNGGMGNLDRAAFAAKVYVSSEILTSR